MDSYYYSYYFTTGRQNSLRDETTTSNPWIKHYYRFYRTQQYPTTPSYSRHYGYNSYATTPRYPRDYGYTSYASTHHYYDIDPPFSYYSGPSYHGPDNACEWLAGSAEVPALVLMFCLAIITARSACLLRAIEQEMPQIEPLPAGKMVVLACPDTAEVTAAATEAVCVAMGEGTPTADMKTEQTDV